MSVSLGDPLGKVHAEFAKQQHQAAEFERDDSFAPKADLGGLTSGGPGAIGRPLMPVVGDPVTDLVRYQGYVSGDLALKAGDGVSTGTTIMGVEFNGGVVLCADSRTSTGIYVANRTSRKISKLHDRIFCCRSGSAADTQFLAATVKNYLGQNAIELGHLPPVNTAANLFKLVSYQNKDHLLAGLIIGGWDPKKGGQIYAIPLGGTKLRQPCAIGGSGSTYITGLVDHLFKPGMTRQEAEAFCLKCVSHAMARDGSSGGLMRLVTIVEEGVFEQCVYGEKNMPYTLQ